MESVKCITAYTDKSICEAEKKPSSQIYKSCESIRCLKLIHGIMS